MKKTRRVSEYSTAASSPPPLAVALADPPTPWLSIRPRPFHFFPLFFSSCNYFTRGFGRFSDVMIFPSNSVPTLARSGGGEGGGKGVVSEAPTEPSMENPGIGRLVFTTPTGLGGGWHVAHYVICPLDQSTGGANFFPRIGKKTRRKRKRYPARRAPALPRTGGPIAIRKEAFFMGAARSLSPYRPTPRPPPNPASTTL